MEFTTFAIAGATIAAAWRYITMAAGYVRSSLIGRATITGEASTDLIAYLAQHGRAIRISDRLLKSAEEFVRPLKRVTTVVWEMPSSQPSFILLTDRRRYGWLSRILVAHCPRSSSYGEQNIIPDPDVLVLSYLRFGFDLNRLLADAIEFKQRLSERRDRFQVYRHTGSGNRQILMPPNGAVSNQCVQRSHTSLRAFIHWRHTDIGAAIPDDPFEAYILSEQTESAKQDFDQWLQLREWHQTRGIPWRRGHLYTGAPGTGKTSLARTLAQSAGIPIFLFDLASMDNREFVSAWESMLDSAPCIAMLEDFDAVFDHRANVAMEGGLTFDCLLNTIGGVNHCDGVFLIVTANQPERIDSAMAGDGMASRPGRIDRVFEFVHSDEQSKRILERILGECSEQDLQAVKMMTPAQVTEYAVQRAKQLLFV